MFDADRSAIIIHALPNNFANIPTRYSATGSDEATLATGDAGGRVACGLITLKHLLAEHLGLDVVIDPLNGR